jgi:GTPase KRas
MPDIPVVVLGGGGVGKSCLTIQYVQGHFVDQYDPTIEDVYRKTIHLDNAPAVLTVVDTAGQDAFAAMRDQYLEKGQGFVLVYSITDTESFQHIRRIYSNLQRVRMGRPTPCVLVGNKIDQDAYRAVSRDKGAHLATEIGAHFLEITAKEHRMCEQVFESLVRTIRSGEGGGSDGAPGVGGGAGDGATGGTSVVANGSNPAPRANSTTGGAVAGATSFTADAARDSNTKIKKKQTHHKCALL